ncbi:MAG: hypothetical protein KKB56_02380 [Gammaproteobacteria bacterium]|nr:hypothetical protein [Gammaproteobacteria bacterium]
MLLTLAIDDDGVPVDCEDAGIPHSISNPQDVSVDHGTGAPGTSQDRLQMQAGRSLCRRISSEPPGRRLGRIQG